MKLTIQHQESYSRSELLLRSFLGFFYIIIPHGIALFFLGLWSAIVGFIAWWAILFTGRYPKSFFEFQVGLLRWNTRVSARMANMVDGYPPFGLDSKDPAVELEVEYPEKLSQGTLLLKSFFGAIYCTFPHMFLLFFRQLWGAILGFIAFWSILFTGKFPITSHEFLTENIRWALRVNLYMSFMSDDYPPFNGKEIESLETPKAEEETTF